MLPMSMPNPIGTSSSGSKFLRMASHTKKHPTASITRFVHSQLAKPVKLQKVEMVCLMNSPKEYVVSAKIMIL